MIEPKTPPEQKKLCKRHIIAEIIICVLAALSAPTLFVPFILIPVAFAFPIILGSTKLLFIPAIMAVVGLLVLLFVDAFAIPLLLLLFAIIGTVGVGAGLLIRCFRKSRKNVKIIVTVLSVIILLSPCLFVVDMFTGIFRMPIASWQVRRYVAVNYADFNLRIGRMRFDFKSNAFNVNIYDSNNSDIWFNIRRENMREIRDGFISGSFWARTLDHMLTPLLEEEFGDEFHRDTVSIAGVRTGFTSSVSGVQVGQPFDLTADVEKTARIIITTESADPEVLAALLSRYYSFISQNGFNFSHYIFHFQYANAPPIRGSERVIDISLSPELIDADLPARIEHARNSRNQNGVFHTAEFRYVSRVDFMPTFE